MTNKFAVKKSPIEGKGIFASADVKKGEIICTMSGRRVSVKKLKEEYAKGKARVDDPFQVADRKYIILRKPYVFFNHSCSPNAGITKIATLIAIKDIKKHEEITFDYSTTEWSDDEHWGINWQKIWKIPCKCGFSNCRKVIREFPTLPASIKRKYYKIGVLPSFIMEKLR